MPALCSTQIAEIIAISQKRKEKKRKTNCNNVCKEGNVVVGLKHNLVLFCKKTKQNFGLNYMCGVLESWGPHREQLLKNKGVHHCKGKGSPPPRKPFSCVEIARAGGGVIISREAAKMETCLPVSNILALETSLGGSQE